MCGLQKATQDDPSLLPSRASDTRPAPRYEPSPLTNEEPRHPPRKFRALAYISNAIDSSTTSKGFSFALTNAMNKRIAKLVKTDSTKTWQLPLWGAATTASLAGQGRSLSDADRKLGGCLVNRQSHDELVGLGAASVTFSYSLIMVSKGYPVHVSCVTATAIAPQPVISHPDVAIALAAQADQATLHISGRSAPSSTTGSQVAMMLLTDCDDQASSLEDSYWGLTLEIPCSRLERDRYTTTRFLAISSDGDSI
ncbi:hypothetical protein SCAR479_06100 [Seiridium cardinale]|uniref:Uncharacterized protein n=1 Tax=Seiridium cardinale TaxID=138064 RepID=A0ABR2XUT6_9PEZI